MGNYALCAFLILFGLSMLIGLALPSWLIGLLAVAAGFLLLVGR